MQKKFVGKEKDVIFAARFERTASSLTIMEEQVQASTENKIDRER